MTWLRKLWRKLRRRKPLPGTGTVYIAPLDTPLPGTDMDDWTEVGYTTLDGIHADSLAYSADLSRITNCHEVSITVPYSPELRKILEES